MLMMLVIAVGFLGQYEWNADSGQRMDMLPTGNIRVPTYEESRKAHEEEIARLVAAKKAEEDAKSPEVKEWNRKMNVFTERFIWIAFVAFCVLGILWGDRTQVRTMPGLTGPIIDLGKGLVMGVLFVFFAIVVGTCVVISQDPTLPR